MREGDGREEARGGGRGEEERRGKMRRRENREWRRERNNHISIEDMNHMESVQLTFEEFFHRWESLYLSHLFGAAPAEGFIVSRQVSEVSGEAAGGEAKQS